MPKCAFSGKEIPKGQGIMYVRKNGQVLWFLNSKSERNFLKLKRKPVNYKWSTHYKKGAAAATKPVAKQEKKAEPKAKKAAPAAKKAAKKE